MFGKDFFIKKQKLLLFLLNNLLTKKWFRRILRIYSKERITEILPNSYSWGDRVTWKKGKFYFHRTTDFRTHNKYSKRIFYAFRPLWLMFHYWDILTRFKSAWNLGFDTFYPDAGTGNTTVDGAVGRTAVDETWGTIRGETGNFASATATPNRAAGWIESASTNQFKDLLR